MIHSMTHRKLSNTVQRLVPTQPRHGATWRTRTLRMSALILAMASTATWASDVKSQETQATADIAKNMANDTDTCYVEGVSDRLNCGFVTVPENLTNPMANRSKCITLFCLR